MAMSYFSATSLRVGDVVMNSEYLEAYPHYQVNAGARFVVVDNTIGESHGCLGLRLIPADMHLAPVFDLEDWNFELMWQNPYWFGIEEDHLDRTDPDSLWQTNEVPFSRVTEAVDLPERLAAVFAAQVYNFVDHDTETMREIARRNQKLTALHCATHDFIDADVAMEMAFRAAEFPMLGDPGHEEGTDMGAAAAYLWSVAWAIAKRWYFAPYLKDGEVTKTEVTLTDSGDVAPL